MIRIGVALLLAALTHLPAAWSAVVTDDDGRRIALAHTPTRIISVAPGATEMLFAAGAGRLIIATVEYSDEPAAAKLIPRIGDGIAVDMERVVALKPDIVVVWPGGGNPAQIAQLARLGLPLYHQQVNALGDIPASLRRLGVLAGTQPAAERAAQDIETRLAQLRRRHRGSPQPSVLLQVWNHPIYTVGGRHLMSDALRFCGARNVFGDLTDMGPAVDVESVMARDPDFIVAVAPPGAAAGWLADWKRFRHLRAVQDDHLIELEDWRLSRLGPSALGGTEALCRAIDGKRRAHP
jgi:iron complex transport system substrate-binding protein